MNIRTITHPLFPIALIGVVLAGCDDPHQAGAEARQQVDKAVEQAKPHVDKAIGDTGEFIRGFTESEQDK